jgi:hypothetical protein
MWWAGRPFGERQTSHAHLLPVKGQEKGAACLLRWDVPFLTLLGEDESPFVGAASS